MADWVERSEKAQLARALMRSTAGPVTERSCPGRDREVSGERGHGLSGSESGQGRAGRGTGTVLAYRAEPGRLGPCKRACGPGKSSWSEERPAGDGNTC
jgi:hypothetical protein